MAQAPEDITVNVVVGNVEKFNVATAELIGFGTVGTLLTATYEILDELDHDLAAELDEFAQKILDRFEAAEEALFNVGKDETLELEV